MISNSQQSIVKNLQHRKLIHTYIAKKLREQYSVIVFYANFYLESQAYKNSSRPKWLEMEILDLPQKGNFLLIDNSTGTNQHAIKSSTNANFHICY